MENNLKFYLKKAQDLINQRNFPQAEIYIRRYLISGGADTDVSILLKSLHEAYGVSEKFTLSEKNELEYVNNKFLLIKAWGYGFWSEIHHLMSQLLVAELTKRIPIILWGTNFLFRQQEDINAFGHFFKEISSARLSDIPHTVSIYPSKWTWDNLYQENINKWEKDGSRLAAQYLFNRSEILLVSDFFSTVHSIIPWIGQDSTYYGLSEDTIYAKLFQKYLRPLDEITAHVHQLWKQLIHKNPKPRKQAGYFSRLAIHIRGSDKIHESPHLTQINDSYFTIIDGMIARNARLGLFLLTDDARMVNLYQNRYGKRLVTTPFCRTASSVGIHYIHQSNPVVLGREVLADALLALQCDYFIGNIESNVSLAISSLRDWPSQSIILLGEHNIRSENLFLHQRDVIIPVSSSDPISASLSKNPVESLPNKRVNENVMEKMNIVFCIDQAYAQHLGVALASLFMHNEARRLMVFIVSSSLERENISKLVSIGKMFGAELHFKLIDEERVARFRKHLHISRATYYRMFLPDLLPNVEKVLYLDCDLVIEGELDALWKINITSLGCAGMDEDSLEQTGRLGLETDFYVNAGVLLLNLTYWREYQIAEACIAWMENNPEKCVLLDQDAINMALRGKKTKIDPCWNLNPVWSSNAISLDVLFKRYPQRILHFGGPIKPWHKCYDFELQAIYRKYLDLTPWSSGFSLMEPKNIGQACLLANQLFHKRDYVTACHYYQRAIDFRIQIRKLESKLLLDCINGGHRHFNHQDYVSACEHYRSCMESWGFPIQYEINSLIKMPGILDGMFHQS